MGQGLLNRTFIPFDTSFFGRDILSSFYQTPITASRIFQSINATAPVQLDANMGWVNAVQEMLLYVSPRRVKLLPALPARWKKGKFEHFRFCTGTLSCSWNRETGRLNGKVVAMRDTRVTLQFPDGFQSVTFAGDTSGVSLSDRPGCYDLDMKAGETLLF